ncbi:MAG: hypothetical protein U9Q83_12470 [Bacteroidota bacterium]|nr:hypothetical protein [Bacteroidota bacterium]
MFLTVLLLSVVIMTFVVLALGVQTFFSKKKTFPATRISRNKEMRKRKIYCGETQQKIIDKKEAAKTCNSCS